jgi:hypothetical protein
MGSGIAITLDDTGNPGKNQHEREQRTTAPGKRKVDERISNALAGSKTMEYTSTRKAV